MHPPHRQRLHQQVLHGALRQARARGDGRQLDHARAGGEPIGEMGARMSGMRIWATPSLMTIDSLITREPGGSLIGTMGAGTC